MIPTTNYPLFKQPHTVLTNHHQPNPPPKQKIISSKDLAIQQLIYENTMLKKQLSQLMLKTTAPAQLSNLNSIESVMTSVRPSVSHLGSCRNSMQNSMEFSSNQFCLKTNNFNNNANNFTDNVCEQKSQHQKKIIVQRQNKRAYRHSVDNLCYGNDWQYYQVINNELQQQNRNLLSRNQNQLKSNVPLVINQRQVRFQNQQNFFNTQPCSFREQQTCISEEEMYREKMMKLKGRRNSQSKRLSEEKHASKPVCHINNALLHNQNAPKVNQVINQHPDNKNVQELVTHQTPKQTIPLANSTSNLIKVHEVLKSKLNSPDYSPTLKSRANQPIKQQKSTINQTYKNSLPLTHLTHEKNQSQEKKMIPKYTPKNFSQEKENKAQGQQKKLLIQNSNQNSSIKAVERKQTESTNQQMSRQQIKQQNHLENEQKKVCLRQLRGRVYLDDQGQGGRTKRAISKNTITPASQKNTSSIVQSSQTNQDQATKRTTLKQLKQQKSKRINTAQSQVTYVDADSFRKLNVGEGYACTEKVMVKKNSNRVYLEEDQTDKHVMKNTIKNKQPKNTKQQVYAKPQKIENENIEQLVSIEEIHMIADKNQLLQNTNNKPAVHTNKRTPPLSRQNSIQTQFRRNKNLYNQVYCEDSKKDLHS